MLFFHLLSQHAATGVEFQQRVTSFSAENLHFARTAALSGMTDAQVIVIDSSCALMQVLNYVQISYSSHDSSQTSEAAKCYFRCDLLAE